MILVDTSVWINLLRGRQTAAVSYFLNHADQCRFGYGDAILFEVLAGCRSARDVTLTKKTLQAFACHHLLNPVIAERAAENFRLLCHKGVTINKPIDLIIATYIILNDYTLLHEDRYYDLMRVPLGLKMVDLTTDSE